MLVFCQVITYTTYEKCSIKCKAVYREAVFVGRAGDSEHEFSVNSEHWQVETVLCYDLVAYLDPRIKNRKPFTLTIWNMHAHIYGVGQVSARGGSGGEVTRGASCCRWLAELIDDQTEGERKLTCPRAGRPDTSHIHTHTLLPDKVDNVLVTLWTLRVLWVTGARVPPLGSSGLGFSDARAYL